MNYQYFAFLDVLGYKDLIRKDVEKNELAFKDKLISSFAALEAVNNAEYRYRSISDSIFISCDQSKDFIKFLKIIKDLYLKFLSNGLFLRGGVSFDRHFENSTILYSMALTRAYELESTKAIFPRIIVDDNVIGVQENLGRVEELRNSGLIVKDGKMHQLHILDVDNWSETYRHASSLYHSEAETIDTLSTARQKHLWFQNYLFHFKEEKVNEPRYMSEWQSF